MNYLSLLKIKKKIYFTSADVADALNIKPKSAHVFCARYVKKGLLLRLKKNFYALGQNWENFSRDDFLKIANFLQVPSYISFASALSVYEVTTQAQRDFFESASLRRSARYSIRGAAFNFYKLKKEYYFDFIKKGDIFIATKEKAFIDSVYLYSFGKYKIDFNAIDLGKFDRQRMRKIIKPFPVRTKDIIKKLCRI